jgi:hypothetical protein
MQKQVDTSKSTSKRGQIERSLLALTEQVLRDRAAIASAPYFVTHREVWEDLDQAYHHVRTALGRVLGESRREGA